MDYHVAFLRKSKNSSIGLYQDLRTPSFSGLRTVLSTTTSMLGNWTVRRLSFLTATSAHPSKELSKRGA